MTQEYGDQFHHIGGVLHGEATLPINDYAQALRETYICINTQTYSFREQCKGKVREALACGTILLEEDNQQTRYFSKEENGIGYFRDFDGLKKLIVEMLDQKNYQAALKSANVFNHEYLTCEKWVSTLLVNLERVRENNEV